MTLRHRECYRVCNEMSGVSFSIGFCWGWTAHLSGYIEPLEPFSRGLFITEMGSVWCRCPWPVECLLPVKRYSVEPIMAEPWMLLSLDDLRTAAADLEGMAICVNLGGFVRFTLF